MAGRHQERPRAQVRRDEALSLADLARPLDDTAADVARVDERNGVGGTSLDQPVPDAEVDHLARRGGDAEVGQATRKSGDSGGTVVGCDADELTRVVGVDDDVVRHLTGCDVVGVPSARGQGHAPPAAALRRGEDHVLLEHSGVGEDGRAGLERVDAVEGDGGQQVPAEPLEVDPVGEGSRRDGHELPAVPQRRRTEGEERCVEIRAVDALDLQGLAMHRGQAELGVRRIHHHDVERPLECRNALQESGRAGDEVADHDLRRQAHPAFGRRLLAVVERLGEERNDTLVDLHGHDLDLDPGRLVEEARDQRRRQGTGAGTWVEDAHGATARKGGHGGDQLGSPSRCEELTERGLPRLVQRAQRSDPSGLGSTHQS